VRARFRPDRYAFVFAITAEPQAQARPGVPAAGAAADGGAGPASGAAVRPEARLPAAPAPAAATSRGGP
jgi:hypothetical protein